MCDELTERVAKAIRGVIVTREGDWDAIGHVAREMYRREAAAAIDVIQAYGEELMERYSITVGLPDDKKTL